MTRYAVVLCGIAVACNSPNSDLFSSNGTSHPEQTSGGDSGRGASSNAGSGAVAVPGAGTGGSAGVGSGVVSGGSGGSSSGGSSQPDGEGGASDQPPLGTAGSSDGTAGSGEPPEPVCGNGKLEVGEECDDEGSVGNGCNSDCEVDCSDFGENAKESDDHHCYNGYDEHDFEAAQQDCVARGAHLVTIADEAENELVQSFVSSSKFIGAFEDVDLTSEDAGTYQWVNGEPFSYENWEAGEPARERSRCGNSSSNGQQCYEHCARMLGDGTWNDQRCDLEDGYVCEWEPAGAR